jgi:hypothetical protein
MVRNACSSEPFDLTIVNKMRRCDPTPLGSEQCRRRFQAARRACGRESCAKRDRGTRCCSGVGWACGILRHFDPDQPEQLREVPFRDTARCRGVRRRGFGPVAELARFLLRKAR